MTHTPSFTTKTRLVWEKKRKIKDYAHYGLLGERDDKK